MKEQDTITNDRAVRHKKTIRTITAFIVTLILLVVVIMLSINIGTIKVSFPRMIKGLIFTYDEDVSSIFDLRFPRIAISLLAGAAVAVSGVLFQAVLKNPLADPGIIGISSGAGFFAVLVTAFLPTMYFLTPIVACAGGLLAFIMVYTLSWKGGLSPLRIILVGVAVDALFTGLSNSFNSMSGGNLSGVASIVNGNITMKTWDDVGTLFPYVVVGLLLSFAAAASCNLLSLEDHTARSLGINVNRTRLLLSFVAVVLAAISTAIVGSISFLGLIVPHMGRLLVGQDHKKLIPYSMLLGALVYLAADTIGRTIASPYEISASIIMSVVGGPFFIIMLRRSKSYGK